jgi:glycosyltransferase involved in cell wall biosynthesis
MSFKPYEPLKPTASKSALFERCRKSIEYGNRGDSISILLTLSALCCTHTERVILNSLKLAHKETFEKKSIDYRDGSRSICGTSSVANSGENTVQGGKRILRSASERLAPKVSIITVNRNCAAGLEKTITSVLNQKNPGFEIEHIVIDGASTDASLEVLSRYSNDLEYFLSEPDGGIYPAMNKGLHYARGEIISFLNSDDTYLSHTAGNSVRNLELNGVDLSYGAFTYTKPNGHVAVVDGPRKWDHSMLIRGIPGGHETFFVRKEIYDLIGGYREDLRISSDYDWMIRAYLAGCSAKPLHSILLEMTMGGLSFDNGIEKAESLQLMREFLGENDIGRSGELYSWKYYKNWQGYTKSKGDQLRLLQAASTLQDFEPDYAEALVKTVNRSYENYDGILRKSAPIAGPGGLRVCMAVTYLNSVVGGAERIAVEAANRLAEEGHAVTLVSCHGVSGEPFYKVDPRVRCIDLANKPLSSRLHKVALEAWEASWKEVTGLLEESEVVEIETWLVGPNKWKALVYKGFFMTNDFDLVISHMPSTYPYIALGLVGGAAPPRHIAQLHNSPAFKFHSKLYPANSDAERSARLSTLKLCDHVAVLYSQYVDELPPGVREKAFVLPNFIGSSFLEKGARSSTTRGRSIVTVGRLSVQKEQKALIDAFSLVKERVGDWQLQIYGEGPLRAELEHYCGEKGLDPKEIFQGRTTTPKAVYEAAGIFVLPSRFEGAPLVLMEAMATGAPVVGFEDCPGVNCIIDNGVNGILVRRDHGSKTLSESILKLINDRELRDRLGSSASETAKLFTIDQHVEKLRVFLKRSGSKRASRRNGDTSRFENLSVALMSSTTSGGAGIAALRLQHGLQELGVSACMFSLKESSMEPSFVLKPTGKDSVLNPENWRVADRKNLRNAGATIFSSETSSIAKSGVKAITSHDIVNLHWVSHFLSPSAVKSLLDSGKPVVWTLHDMLPFTGGCHYTSGCEKFTTNCVECPQVIDNYHNHPQTVLELKERLWENHITIISPSQWLADEARRSRIFRNSRIEVVPNGIDTKEYQSCDRERAREILGLPQGQKIILFTCHTHVERRKGFFEALIMLSLLRRQRDDIHLVTLGRPSEDGGDLGFSHTNLGFVKSSAELSLIYSACDVTLLPSLEDNLPNVILESLSCGTPVAGFRTGGIGDLIKDGETGYLAPTKDLFALRDAVEKCLTTDLKRRCRDYATEHLDSTRQAVSYARIFESLIQRQPTRR